MIELALRSILEAVETPSPQSGDLALPLSSAPQSSRDLAGEAVLLPDLPRSLLHELWLSARAEDSGLTLDEFSSAVSSVGTKFNMVC
jgi:hypothetical protein